MIQMHTKTKVLLIILDTMIKIVLFHKKSIKVNVNRDFISVINYRSTFGLVRGVQIVSFMVVRHSGSPNTVSQLLARQSKSLTQRLLYYVQI